MNYEKIGLFIKSLREQINLTQNDLANILNISRQSVSKWERGITIPDASILVLLSDIFKVSINEILAGERLTKENTDHIKNITLEVLEDKQTIKKKFTKLLIVFLISITVFLFYYFINSYNRFRVYVVNGTYQDKELFDGLIVSTGSKLYIKLLKVDNEKIEHLKLYYKNRDEREITLYESDEDYISLIDFYGINTNLKLSDLKYIKNNLYLVFNNHTIHLEVLEDYRNTKLIFKKNTSNSNQDDKNDKTDHITTDSYPLANSHMNIFDHLLNDGVLYENSKYKFIYIKDLNLVKLDFLNEEYTYDLENKTLQYKEYDKGELIHYFIKGKDTCIIGNCEDKKIEKFWRYVNETLK